MARQVKRVVFSQREDADLDEVIHWGRCFDAGAVRPELLRYHFERHLVLSVRQATGGGGLRLQVPG
jgi:hypothetical protein